VLQDSTVTANTANGTGATAGGGGISRTSTLNNTLTIVNSVVSGNTNANAPDIRTDPFTTTHVNFSAIGSGTGFAFAPDSGNNLPVGANLMLGGLAFNGGPTRTHALSGGPLIDAGSNAAVPSGLTTDQRGPGFARITGGTVDIGAFERDAIAPNVVTAEFHYLSAPQSVRLTFSKNVAASLTVGDVELKNLKTGATIPAANTALSYDGTANVATFTFPGYAYGALPDGDYRATLGAGSVTDGSGNALAADFTYDFFFMNGDANRDRKVEFGDLVILAQNYNTAGGRTFDLGDFTYDGNVDFNDLVVLAQRYNTALPAPTPAAALSVAIRQPRAKSIFALAPVKKPAAIGRKILPRRQ
jgi:hypothetical protein